jgi:hypothetical protein
MPPTVRKALAQDFERVYPLLREFHHPRLRKADYATIFQRRWGADEDYHGYLLEDGAEVVGFLGLLFSRRLVGGKDVKFCNLSHWFVRPAYRRHSVSMLLPVLGLRGYTLTDLSAVAGVATLLEALRFVRLGSTYRLVLPFPGLRHFLYAPRCRIVQGAARVRGLLGPHEQRLLDDHRRLDCHHFLLRGGAGQCYVVLTRPVRERLPFAFVLYVGDRAVFREYLGAFRLRVGLDLKVVALVIDDKFLDGVLPWWSVNFQSRETRFFRSDRVPGDAIDYLYSEFALLNL